MISIFRRQFLIFLKLSLTYFFFGKKFEKEGKYDYIVSFLNEKRVLFVGWLHCVLFSVLSYYS